MVRLLMHLRVTPDRKTLETWLGDQMGNLAAWVSFWPFFIVLVEKCLGPRGAQATSRAVQALYDEIVEEVIISIIIKFSDTGILQILKTMQTAVYLIGCI